MRSGGPTSSILPCPALHFASNIWRIFEYNTFEF